MRDGQTESERDCVSLTSTHTGRGKAPPHSCRTEPADMGGKVGAGWLRVQA